MTCGTGEVGIPETEEGIDGGIYGNGLSDLLAHNPCRRRRWEDCQGDFLPIYAASGIDLMNGCLGSFQRRNPKRGKFPGGAVDGAEPDFGMQGREGENGR
jgi:hypothetical protein